MAVARALRQQGVPTGPHRASERDIASLNSVFSEAFTDRYRRDGLAGVRVPFLNPAVWRFAIADAGDGAMLWRNDDDNTVAFCLTHLSGTEGWMGPLAVHPDYQGQGLGKVVVRCAVDWLAARGARVIGLETMPRTMDNIGFYSALGFVPGHLTLTLSLDASEYAPMALHDEEYSFRRLASYPPHETDAAVALCRQLAQRLAGGCDYSREILLTEEMSLGDTMLVSRGHELVAFAVCHSVPLVEGRTRDELRVLKLVSADEESFDALCAGLLDHARRSGTRRVAMRLQGEYTSAYGRLIRCGARVRWTDLRMSLEGFTETQPARGVLLSNWEI